MRLFVAVVPPPEAVAPVAEVLPALAAAAPGLRFPPADKWHVTLVFLGEVSERQVDRLRPGLAAAAASADPFPLSLAGGGTFPGTAARARVLWAGIGGDIEQLSLLAGGARRAARAAGVTVERRPFRAHLTLARARRGPADATAALSLLEGLAGPAWTVPELQLVRSTLGPQARYDLVESWPLGGAS